MVIGDNSSEWVDVTSSVPQGSVLGPLLFTIFINDLPENIKNQCKLYADDCKLIGVVENEGDLEQVQVDIDKLQLWAKTWQMSFNYDKCKVMHFGKNNAEREYKIDLGQNSPPHIIEKTLIERDLGIIIANDLKWVHQIEKAVQTAKAIISQIRNSFMYFDAELVRLLYVSLIRPHLEYAVPVWNPYLKGDIDNIENVQHRATRLVPGIKRKGYKYRVKTLRITTLETRRKRGDLIQFYKIINKIDHVNLENGLQEKNRGIESGPAGNLRRQGVCFHRELGKIKSIRDNFFTNRVIPLWNDLPVEIKEARTLDSFKAGLDKLKVFTI